MLQAAEIQNKMPKTVIFDLDGTLADISERMNLALEESTGKFNWPVFFNPDNIVLDRPNSPVISAYLAMQQAGFRMVIFSGRVDSTRGVTEEWLKSNGITWDLLKMRPAAPPVLFMKDDSLKEMWLDEEFPGERIQEIECVFDDRDKVVAMWRRRGIPCFQVAPGDF